MLHKNRLIRKTSKFLNQDVLDVGVFDVSLKWSRRHMHQAVGIGTYVGTKKLEKKLGYDGPGKRLAAAGCAVAGSKMTKNMVYERNAARMGLTPIMLVAVTKQTLYLLDWDGNHNHGKFHRILMEFDLQTSTIKLKKRGLTHQKIELWSEDRYSYAKIECNLGLTHSNTRMNRGVRRLLKNRYKLVEEEDSDSE